MEKELKDHLERIENRISGVENRMATKDDIARLEKQMATKSDLKKVNDGLLKYLEHIDETLQTHVRDSEMHLKVPSPF